MLCRGIALILICVAMSSAVYAQGKPTIQTTPPRLPVGLKGLKIKLCRTPCFGFCPDYSVSIFGDGTVTYEGRRFVKIKGKRQSRVSIDAVQRLANRFVSSNYFALQLSYGQCGGDLPTAVTSIEWTRVKKTVTDCGELPVVTIPSVLRELELAIDITADSQQWVGVDTERANY